jgi:hypothetical protein
MTLGPIATPWTELRIIFASERRSAAVRGRDCRERLLHVEVPLPVAIQHLPVVHFPPLSTEQAATLQTTCAYLNLARKPVASVLLQSSQYQSGIDGRAARSMMVCAAGHESASFVVHN